MTLERDYLLKDRYRILDVLGQGGMGAVYRAKDENLGVEVAVKENLFTSDEYSRQFRREATILANLRHANLPRVFDHFDVADQGQYMVMDYIEGEDLRQRMDRLGMLPDEEVIIMGAAICDALQYLHTRMPPILHRDIKPGNIKISPIGQVYLVDFGLAKIVQGTQVTTTGARAMTPGYSSPEQYGTARTDARSDIYSLGATLYAALTNTIPEDGLARAMEQADLTPVRKRNSKVSRRVAAVIEKALAVHPEDRYQSVEEFKVNLLLASTATRQIRASEELTVPPPPQEVVEDIAKGKGSIGPGATQPEITGTSTTRKRRQRAQRVRRAVFGILVTLLMVIVGWLGLGMPGNELIAGFIPQTWIEAAAQAISTINIGMPPIGTVTPMPQPDFTPTVATDGPTIVPTPEPTLTPTEVPPTSTPTITPTLVPLPGLPTPTPAPLDFEEPLGNESLAFASARNGLPQIFMYSFADGVTTQLTEMNQGACQPEWSPDGRRLAFISPCQGNQRIYLESYIFVLEMETGEAVQLAVEQGSFDPAWSPDGTSILFTKAESMINSGIYRLTLLDGKVELMSNTERLSFNPAWSPDGQQLVFASNRSGDYFLYIMPNIPEAEIVAFAHTEGRVYSKPTWGIRDVIVYSRGPIDSFPSLMYMPARLLGSSDLLYKEEWLNVKTVREAELDPDFNSTGHWIAFEGWPDGVNRDIYIIRIDGQLVIRITEHGSADFDPVWMPHNSNQ